jgi:TPR repeat protein
VKWWRQAANQGHSMAQFCLGRCYEEGKGVGKNNREAVCWVRRAADQGCTHAQYGLAVYYHEGQLVDQDDKKAVDWLHKCARQGHPDGQYRVGMLICEELKGIVAEQGCKEVDQRCRSAVEWFNKAAQQGHTNAQYQLGQCHTKGNGVDKNHMKAMEWFRKAAQQGHELARDGLVVYDMYENIKQARTTASTKKGKREQVWYKLHEDIKQLEIKKTGNCFDWSTIEVDTQFQCRLGLAYKWIVSDTAEQTDEKSVQYFRMSSDGGDPQGQCCLAVSYEFGEGVEQDPKKAVDWYTESALQNYALAQFRLGLCFSYGIGTDKNKSNAFQLFNLAAQQKHAGALYELGKSYQRGRGVEQHKELAFDCFIESAFCGNVRAMYSAALCFLHGEGTTETLQRAVEEFRLAAAEGCAKSQNNLGVLSEMNDLDAVGSEGHVKWYKKSASQNRPEALHNLGMCYETGKGVKKHVAKAIRLYNRAAFHYSYAKSYRRLVHLHKVLVDDADDVD